MVRGAGSYQLVVVRTESIWIVALPHDAFNNGTYAFKFMGHQAAGGELRDALVHTAGG